MQYNKENILHAIFWTDTGVGSLTGSYSSSCAIWCTRIISFRPPNVFNTKDLPIWVYKMCIIANAQNVFAQPFVGMSIRMCFLLHYISSPQTECVAVKNLPHSNSTFKAENREASKYLAFIIKIYFKLVMQIHAAPAYKALISVAVPRRGKWLDREADL